MLSKFIRVILATALFGGALLNCSAALAQTSVDLSPSDKDPARWYVEDSTARAQVKTSQKEAAAAYQQALAECRKMRGAEAKSCVKEARDNYQSDMADAKKPRTEPQPQSQPQPQAQPQPQPQAQPQPPAPAPASGVAPQ
ncbi:hypothetical protein ACFQAT_03675 [Undibacterium arcticum]|uniref:Uncharacterized protein n=1 Tax=Undibacterium arcticum TaxID=1762892 RepID=A0ABV7F0Q4_9BURK